MPILVAGQDESTAVDVANKLGGFAAVVGADATLTPVADPQSTEVTAVVYLLDAAVPADTVDATAVNRLARRFPTVVAATGMETYPDAAATIVESGRRLGAPVTPMAADGAAVRAALEVAPAPNEPTAAATDGSGEPESPAAQRGQLERADRAAYLRSTIARLRAALLAEAGERLRFDDDEQSCPGSGPAHVQWLTERLSIAGAELEASLHRKVRAAYRGTFAGWPNPPEPAESTLPTPDLPDPPRVRKGPEDVIVLALGASAGLGIGRAAATPLEALGSARWLAVPLSLAVGVVVALWLLQVRRRSTSRTTWKSWTSAAVGAHRHRVEVDLSAALVAAESDAALRLARGPGTDAGADASKPHGP